MEYEEIYSRSYIKKYDPTFFDDQDFAYETMQEWLHEIAAESYVRKIFKTLELNDDNSELTYELVDPTDSDYDDDFVKKIFSDGMIICWMRPKVDSVLNLSMMFGGKEEKKLMSNYSVNKERLTELEIKHRKYVRNHGYDNASSGTE